MQRQQQIKCWILMQNTRLCLKERCTNLYHTTSKFRMVCCNDAEKKKVSHVDILDGFEPF